MTTTGTAHRVVLDANIFIRGFVNPNSASGRIILAGERREFILLLSRDVLREYHEVLFHPTLASRHPRLRESRTRLALERIRYVSDFYRDITTPFSFARDPKDAPFIELAITGSATHLISVDNDLLSLANGRDEYAKRLRHRMPRLEILDPLQYVRRYLP